jgi:hypothetical protein
MSSNASAMAESSWTRLSAGYAPFNIPLLNGNLYETYGLPNNKKTNVVAVHV